MYFRDIDISTLKMLAALDLGMEQADTALVIGGVPVPKTKTLTDCGVKDGDILLAMTRAEIANGRSCDQRENQDSNQQGKDSLVISAGFILEPFKP